jgi:hypothetical protein
LTIAGLLGHSSRGITQRYVHLDSALIIAADQVSVEMAGLLDGCTMTMSRAAKHQTRSGAPSTSPFHVLATQKAGFHLDLKEWEKTRQSKRGRQAG